MMFTIRPHPESWKTCTLETFRTQKKTALSFTDAAIITVAKRRQGSPIATFDRDFRRVEGISTVP